jgi:hypothetical protein
MNMKMPSKREQRYTELGEKLVELGEELVPGAERNRRGWVDYSDLSPCVDCDRRLMSASGPEDALKRRIRFRLLLDSGVLGGGEEKGKAGEEKGKEKAGE